MELLVLVLVLVILVFMLVFKWWVCLIFVFMWIGF